MDDFDLEVQCEEIWIDLDDTIVECPEQDCDYPLT